MFVDFLLWHYTKGFDVYLRKWLRQMRLVNHYYSPLLLLKTLFDPWKRLIEIDKRGGFDFQRFFEGLMFNLISRIMGALARIALLFISMCMFFIVGASGFVGLIFWTLVPPVGLPEYFRFTRSPEEYTKRLVASMEVKPSSAVQTLYTSSAGKFISDHMSVAVTELIQNAHEKKPSTKDIHDFSEFMSDYIKDLYSESFLKSHSLEQKNFLDTAYMWDEKLKIESGYKDNESYGRPGFAVDLIYGYTPTLTKYAIDLSQPQTFSHRLIGRTDLESKIERILTGGNSVILIGDSGVGKKTAILEFSERAINGRLGPKMAYQKVYELDYNALLSGSHDLNTKKNILSQVLTETSTAGNIILMIRDIHRLTNTDVEGYDFTDTFEEYMEKRDLRIIAVSTPHDYERFVVRNLRLRKYLKEVEIVPPEREDVMKILIESALFWERQKNLLIQTPALRQILEASDKYITEVPFPEKALELLEAVIEYVEQSKRKVVSVEDANKVLAEKTGISFSYITQTEKTKLTNLEHLIHEKLVNQKTAISLIAKSLRSRSVGAKKEDRPIGSFLFLGPTGVGKTETAKVLANTYFGSEKEIVRFDMAEYQGTEGIERLLGSVKQGTPGVLTTAIKNKPAGLLLFDELEKAPLEIRNILMTLLDEGYITDAFGKKVIGRHLFIIATSNAEAEYIRTLVNRNVAGEDLQKQVVEHVLKEGIFTPEFINRFDGVVVYEPLTGEYLQEIARLMLSDLIARISDKDISLTYGEDVIAKLAYEGFEPAFGARPMRRIVDLTLGDILGKEILSDTIKAGDTIKIIAGQGKGEYSLEKIVV